MGTKMKVRAVTLLTLSLFALLMPVYYARQAVVFAVRATAVPPLDLDSLKTAWELLKTGEL